jgi:hypothetical protein
MYVTEIGAGGGRGRESVGGNVCGGGGGRSEKKEQGSITFIVSSRVSKPVSATKPAK